MRGRPKGHYRHLFYVQQVAAYNGSLDVVGGARKRTGYQSKRMSATSFVTS